MIKDVAQLVDTVGMKCPEPILKIAMKVVDMKPNDILEVVGDCPTFEEDIRDWCKRLGKKILSINHENRFRKRVWIRI